MSRVYYRSVAVAERIPGRRSGRSARGSREFEYAFSPTRYWARPIPVQPRAPPYKEKEKNGEKRRKTEKEMIHLRPRCILFFAFDERVSRPALTFINVPLENWISLALNISKKSFSLVRLHAYRSIRIISKR